MSGIATEAFPKYTTQLINWANQNAQGTRPRTVGQLSELFQQFLAEADSATVEAWEQWYAASNPSALNDATDKIFLQIQNLQQAITKIDRAMVAKWVHDLVIHKTYTGLYVQQVVLAAIARQRQCQYRLATPDEEAKGIDGFVGNRPYSIKPMSYRDTMMPLPEHIGVTVVYYEKRKDGLLVEFDD